MATRQISINEAERYCKNLAQIPQARYDVMRDWGLEYKLLKNIKVILADYFIIKDIEADLHNDIDFMCFVVGDSTVGVRLRRYNYYIRSPKKIISDYSKRAYYYYPRDEFTVRSKRPSGVPTQIDKIFNGNVTYFLYGFVNEPQTDIIQWFLGDLDIFRSVKPEPIDSKWNKNRDSEFYAYKIKSLPETFIVNSLNLP